MHSNRPTCLQTYVHTDTQTHTRIHMLVRGGGGWCSRLKLLPYMAGHWIPLTFFPTPAYSTLKSSSQSEAIPLAGMSHKLSIDSIKTYWKLPTWHAFGLLKDRTMLCRGRVWRGWRRGPRHLHLEIFMPALLPESKTNPISQEAATSNGPGGNPAQDSAEPETTLATIMTSQPPGGVPSASVPVPDQLGPETVHGCWLPPQDVQLFHSKRYLLLDGRTFLGFFKHHRRFGGMELLF